MRTLAPFKSARKIATMFAAASATAVFTAGTASAQEINNWHSPFGLVWKNGNNELCWRSASWTPQTATPECDGALQPPPAPIAPPPPVVNTPAVVDAPPAAQASAPSPVTLRADTTFDFDEATLKPQARETLDQLIVQIGQLDELEALTVVGHTDHIGTHEYNQQLSERRAASVKNYLVDQGLDANHIHAEGKGETMPVASNASPEGRAQNRRVEIEIIGSRVQH